VLLVCAGLITLLVIIYKGHTPSSVHARSQEVLGVVFAGVLCYTGLTSEAHRVSVLDRQTYQGGTLGSRLCGEDRDRETKNSKVCARTRDTRFI
jgi:hypothetical protein